MPLSRTTTWTDVVTCTVASARLRYIAVFGNQLATASVFIQVWSGSTGVTPGTTASDLVIPVRPPLPTAIRIEPTKIECGGLLFDGLVYAATVTSTGGGFPNTTFVPDSVQVDWSEG